MAEELERSKRHNVSLSLIIIDIDDFKLFNDTYGHLAGDEALRASAKSLRASIRTIDVAARYGGEEFTVILPQTEKRDAAIIAERICGEVKKIRLSFDRSPEEGKLTVSLGLATFPEDARTQEELINNADVALYRAKTQGKDRVVLYEKTSPT
jgi:diguanylate cyclase (GGDEF)-like protein